MAYILLLYFFKVHFLFFLLYLVLIFVSFQLVSDLNVYNILEPCYHGTESKIQLAGLNLPLSFRMLGETKRPLPVRKRMFGRAWPFRAPVREGYVPTWPELLNEQSAPCTVIYPKIYLSAILLTSPASYF